MSWTRDKRMYFSIEEFSELTGTPYGTVNYKVHTEESLRPHLFGKTLVFSEAQVQDYKENGKTDLDCDVSGVVNTEQAVEYLKEKHGLDISYDAVVALRNSGAIRCEEIGGTDSRTALILFHKDDLDIYAGLRGATGNVIRERQYFSPTEAEDYTVAIGSRVPRNTLLHNARKTKRLHPVEIDGVLVFSAEQLRDFAQSESRRSRKSDVKIDRRSIMTPAEVAEELGMDIDQVHHLMFVDARIPYEPVGMSSRGPQVHLIRRSDIDELKRSING